MPRTLLLAVATLIATCALAAEPADSVRKARQHSANREHAQAVAELTKAIEAEPTAIALVDERGSENLLAGKFEAALADFDAYLAKHPDQAPYHWKRGIALYYAGRFEDGVKQFDLHQTVNSADVENAVWRYLCMARRDGVKKAEADILKIGRDPRVPMHEVYELYAGRMSPDDVLKAAKAETAGEEASRIHQFYAHLYLGLYYDARGDAKQAAEHMRLAADKKFLVDHYMGGIAIVHRDLLDAKLKPAK